LLICCYCDCTLWPWRCTLLWTPVTLWHLLWFDYCDYSCAFLYLPCWLRCYRITIYHCDPSPSQHTDCLAQPTCPLPSLPSHCAHSLIVVSCVITYTFPPPITLCLPLPSRQPPPLRSVPSAPFCTLPLIVAVARWFVFVFIPRRITLTMPVPTVVATLCACCCLVAVDCIASLVRCTHVVTDCTLYRVVTLLALWLHLPGRVCRPGPLLPFTVTFAHSLFWLLLDLTLVLFIIYCYWYCVLPWLLAHCDLTYSLFPSWLDCYTQYWIVLIYYCGYYLLLLQPLLWPYCYCIVITLPYYIVLLDYCIIVQLLHWIIVDCVLYYYYYWFLCIDLYLLVIIYCSTLCYVVVVMLCVTLYIPPPHLLVFITFTHTCYSYTLGWLVPTHTHGYSLPHILRLHLQLHLHILTRLHTPIWLVDLYDLTVIYLIILVVTYYIYYTLHTVVVTTFIYSLVG